MLQALLARIRAHLIDDWRNAHRFLSIQLHAAALLWVALYALAPVLPPEFEAVIPSPLRPSVIAGYSLLGIAARLIAQRPVPPVLPPANG